ncbi:hypothetical protein [Kitasatospora sp. NPDC087315]|uniref:hypothetical protein n=1 Tax=Kitasatospora sp. NPDC087315 TaxID=3364069 RepID=UPI003814FA29
MPARAEEPLDEAQERGQRGAVEGERVEAVARPQCRDLLRDSDEQALYGSGLAEPLAGDERGCRSLAGEGLVDGGGGHTEPAGEFGGGRGGGAGPGEFGLDLERRGGDRAAPLQVGPGVLDGWLVAEVPVARRSAMVSSTAVIGARSGGWRAGAVPSR